MTDVENIWSIYNIEGKVDKDGKEYITFEDLAGVMDDLHCEKLSKRHLVMMIEKISGNKSGKLYKDNFIKF